MSKKIYLVKDEEHYVIAVVDGKAESLAKTIASKHDRSYIEQATLVCENCDIETTRVVKGGVRILTDGSLDVRMNTAVVTQYECPEYIHTNFGWITEDDESFVLHFQTPYLSEVDKFIDLWREKYEFIDHKTLVDNKTIININYLENVNGQPEVA